jgi:hypothetical protein
MILGPDVIELIEGFCPRAAPGMNSSMHPRHPKIARVILATFMISPFIKWAPAPPGAPAADAMCPFLTASLASS